MNTNTILHHPQVTSKIKYLPAISIIVPVPPVIAPKNQLEHKLKLITEKIELKLINSYAAEKAEPVLAKLKNIVSDLDYNTHKRSIAIFVSPVVEKVFYVDALLEEKIAIDEFYEIRDQVFRKERTVELYS